MGLSRVELSILMDCAGGSLSHIELGVIPGYLDDNSCVVIAPAHAQIMVNHYANLKDNELSGVNDLGELFTHIVAVNREINKD